MSGKGFRSLKMFGVYLFLFVTLALLIGPPLWIFLMSIKSSAIAFRIPPVWVFLPTLENFIAVTTRPFFFKFLLNSIVVGVVVAVIDLLIGSFAAYSMSRFRTGGRATMFLVLAFDTIPVALLGVPFFILFTRLQLMDTVLGLIIANGAVNLPFAIWLLIPYFNEVPIELEEAAMIDGCGRYGALWRVTLPLVQPGIVVVGILTFMSAWNNFFFPLILASHNAKTMTLVASEFITDWQVLWGETAAMTVVLLLPPVLVVMALQRRLVRGLTLGSVK